MATVRELVEKVVKAQPEDVSYEEIKRELAFDRMIARGMEHCRAGRVIDNSEMTRRIKQWRD